LTVPVSATEPDWSREGPRKWWDPGRRLLRSIRRYQAVKDRPAGAIRRRYWALQHRFWTIVTQAEIDLNARVAGGLLLPHPNGVVIHPDAEIGPNCLIMQQATIGTNRGGAGAPRIGGHVDIGPGARLLGPIVIGDHAVIGANSVVLQDIPARAVAVGAPARVVRIAEAD
jgi:serine O-acetyltransferase